MSTRPIVQLPTTSPATGSDRIRVFLRDCQVDLRVGIYETEKQKPQPILVNIEVEAALPHHYQDLAETKLDRVINYETFYEFLHTELPDMGHIPLLETIAEQIVAFCFRDVRVRQVRVRLEKPHVFDGASAGIEICRTR